MHTAVERSTPTRDKSGSKPRYTAGVRNLKRRRFLVPVLFKSQTTQHVCVQYIFYIIFDRGLSPGDHSPCWAIRCYWCRSRSNHKTDTTLRTAVLYERSSSSSEELQWHSGWYRSSRVGISHTRQRIHRLSGYANKGSSKVCLG